MKYYFRKGSPCALRTCVKLLLLMCLSSVVISIWLSWPQRANTPPNTALLIDTPGCSIADIDPYDVTVRHLVSNPRFVKCNATPPITFTDGEVLRINRTALRLYYTDKLSFCEYQTLWKSNASSDNLYEYSHPAMTFREDVALSSEFIRVACYSEAGDMIYSNLHAFIIEKEQVEEHCDESFKAFTRKHTPKESLSVIMLGVDSVSRLNMMRHLPNTRRFLLEKMRAIELRGYNKLADNTAVNLLPMLAGKFISELPAQHETFDHVDFLWKDFSAAGYRTLFAEDAPKIAIFNYAKEGFYRQPTDYYLRPFSLALEDHGSVWSQNHDCVGDRLETELVLDWVSDFASTFSDRPYFAKAFITRLTHDDVNKAASADRPYLQFLQRLETDGSLENTILIFYSDHGMRFGAVRQTYIGKLEERLPFMYVAFPKWFSARYPDLWRILRVNSNRLTTPFDIYETLRDFLPFSGVASTSTKVRRGISLLAEVPVERTCDQASVSAHWCACNRHRASRVNDRHVRNAATHVVKFINTELLHHHRRCSVLRLDATMDAMRTTDQYGGATYLLVLRTQPGGALFEATVQLKDAALRIVGDISRINRYGDQAKCITYHAHKKFCYCK